MTLIFLAALIVLTVSSFSKSHCLDFIANDECSHFIWPQYTGLSGVEQMPEFNTSCNRSQNQFPSFKMHLS